MAAQEEEEEEVQRRRRPATVDPQHGRSWQHGRRGRSRYAICGHAIALPCALPYCLAASKEKDPNPACKLTSSTWSQRSTRTKSAGWGPARILHPAQMLPPFQRGSTVVDLLLLTDADEVRRSIRDAQMGALTSLTLVLMAD